MNIIPLIYGLVAVICAALLAYTLTPPIRVLAYKIGAIDIPADARRMHTFCLVSFQEAGYKAP